jgi:DNA-binding transcriptional MerR regulator
VSSRQLPDKLYFRIGEVADIVGVEPHVLRYWESEFRSVRPEKSRTGQRVYSRRDVERLLKVKDLLYGHGYTIAGAKKKLRAEGIEPVAENDGPSQEAARLREALAEVRSDLAAALADVDSWSGE